jgi:hypothetical protein
MQPALLLAATSVAYFAPQEAYTTVARGVVFHDQNGNGRRERDEQGLQNVRVSNGRHVVRTDKAGKWELPCKDGTILFITKPRNWALPQDELGREQFHYIYKPRGSAPNPYGGTSPTGKLPWSVDFPLYQSYEPNKFDALMLGDTQPRNTKEVEMLNQTVVDPIVKRAAPYAFAAVLGDVVHDDLFLMKPTLDTLGRLGLPMKYVIGNHDVWWKAKDDDTADDFWEANIGPTYYSFDYGPVHFVLLDSIYWTGQKTMTVAGLGLYTPGLGERQLAWLTRDIAETEPDQLVVLMMHVPLDQLEERADILRLLSTRPKNLSISAHMHWFEQKFFGPREGYTGGGLHHHIINGAACGSWWKGSPDETGFPRATMRCGAPPGYSILSFSGNNYSFQFRAARREPTHQIRIWIAEPVVTNAEVYANFFAGTRFSKVEISVDAGAWTQMKQISEPDPFYVAMFKKDAGVKPPYEPLLPPINSPHLWKSSLSGLKPGSHEIRVRGVDLFGQRSEAKRTIMSQAGVVSVAQRRSNR